MVGIFCALGSAVEVVNVATFYKIHCTWMMGSLFRWVLLICILIIEVRECLLSFGAELFVFQFDI